MCITNSEQAYKLLTNFSIFWGTLFYEDVLLNNERGGMVVLHMVREGAKAKTTGAVINDPA
jgi:hypothetical protein